MDTIETLYRNNVTQQPQTPHQTTPTPQTRKEKRKFAMNGSVLWASITTALAIIMIFALMRADFPGKYVFIFVYAGIIVSYVSLFYTARLLW